MRKGIRSTWDLLPTGKSFNTIGQKLFIKEEAKLVIKNIRNLKKQK